MALYSERLLLTIHTHTLIHSHTFHTLIYTLTFTQIYTQLSLSLSITIVFVFCCYIHIIDLIDIIFGDGMRSRDVCCLAVCKGGPVAPRLAFFSFRIHFIL